MQSNRIQRRPSVLRIPRHLIQRSPLPPNLWFFLVSGSYWTFRIRSLRPFETVGVTPLDFDRAASHMDGCPAPDAIKEAMGFQPFQCRDDGFRVHVATLRDIGNRRIAAPGGDVQPVEQEVIQNPEPGSP